MIAMDQPTYQPLAVVTADALEMEPREAAKLVNSIRVAVVMGLRGDDTDPTPQERVMWSVLCRYAYQRHVRRTAIDDWETDAKPAIDTYRDLQHPLSILRYGSEWVDRLSRVSAEIAQQHPDAGDPMMHLHDALRAWKHRPAVEDRLCDEHREIKLLAYMISRKDIPVEQYDDIVNR